MSTDYIVLGSTPADESCARLGGPDYPRLSNIELGVYKRQLYRQSPSPDVATAFLAVKSFEHDYGTYREVVAVYDVHQNGAMSWALTLEATAPLRWDVPACNELVAALSKAGLDVPDTISERALPVPVGSPEDAPGLTATQRGASTKPTPPVEPDIGTLTQWCDDGTAEALDGCTVEPDGTCPHGSPSWLLHLGLI